MMGRITAACLAAMAATLVAQTTLFIHPNGQDANPGTEDKPLKTLRKAQQIARKARSQNPQKTLEIILKPGRYYLDQTLKFDQRDSGTAQHPLLIAAEQPGTVVITGGTSVPSQAFKPVTDPEQKKRLDPQALPNIRMADLNLLGIPRHPKIIRSPREKARTFPEVFFNGTRMTLARWPDKGWVNISRIIDPGSKMNDGGVGSAAAASYRVPKNPIGGTFAFTEDRPLTWNTDETILLRGYWCFDWSEEVIKLGKMDRKNKTITLATQHTYGLRQGNPSPRRWYALNIPSELTAPGEFYLDQEKNLLFIYPPQDLDKSTVTISTNRRTLLAFANAQHITLRNLILEEASSGIYADRAEHLSILACTVRNCHQQGISLRNTKNCVVHSCDVHHTGTGGIAVFGTEFKTLTPQNNLVENCHIHHFSEHKLTYSNGITLAGVANVARHNLVHHAPHMAIGMSGNNGLFEYNVVHHVCLAADDSGALYKGRNPARRGNLVRFNLWHSIGKPMGHGVAAIYFDDGDVGETVYGNIFFRSGDPGRGAFGTIFSHGGHELTAENNIFIECKRPLGSSPWNDRRWQKMLDSPLWQYRLLKEVDITKPPYITMYPTFKGFMKPKPGTPRVSQAKNNVFLMCASVKSGNWQVGNDNWITDQDPGFVNLNGGDFNLRKDAKVFKVLPDFKPIPFDKIGLYACPLRPVVSREPWTLEPPKQLPPLANVRQAPARILGPKANAPTWKVPMADRQPKLDGVMTPGEWKGKPIVLTMNYDGYKGIGKQFPQAWLQRDQDNLYLAVKVSLPPQANINTNTWGEAYAVEFAIRPPGRNKPIAVARGFANGFFYFGFTADGTSEPLNQDPSPALLATTAVPGKFFIAEFKFPFEKLDLNGQALQDCYFNVTSRDPVTDHWLMWSPTFSHSTNVTQAAKLTW